MLNWLKQKLGLGNKLSNPERLTTDTIELLKRDFSKLDQASPTLSSECVRYIVDGGDNGILTKLKSLDKIGLTLKLQSLRPPSQLASERDRSRVELFTRPCIDNPRIILRLSNVYAAAASPFCRHYLPGLRAEAPGLEILLQEAFPPRVTDENPAITLQTIEAVLDSLKLPRALLQTAWLRARARKSAAALPRIPGFRESYQRYPQAVEDTLSQNELPERVLTLEILQELNPPLSTVRPLILDLALGSSKQLRRAASALIETNSASNWTSLVQEACIEGKAAQRTHAVTLLGALDPVGSRPFLAALTDQKLPKSVEQAISQVSLLSQSEETFDIPQLELDQSDLKPSLRPLIETLIDRHNDQVGLILKEGKYFEEPSLLGEEATESILDALSSLRAGVEPSHDIYLCHYPKVREALQATLKAPELTLVQALRLAIISRRLPNRVSLRRRDTTFYFPEFIDCYRVERETECTLLHLFQALKYLGYEMGRLDQEHALIKMGDDWDPEHVWPFYSSFVPELQNLLRDKFEWNRATALRRIGAFPKLPAPFHQQLWELSLRGTLKDRQASQSILSRTEGFEERLFSSLTSSQKGDRIESADWLAKLKLESAAPFLRKAVRKEKVEAALAAMLTAMEAVGENIDEFVSKESLRNDARKGLKKGLPNSLDWLPLDQLPPVHWLTGEPVEESTVHWLLVRAVKLKIASPGAMLVRYAQLMNAEQTADLAQFVLESFLRADSVEGESPAAKCKGILSLVGACGDQRVAPPIERHLKKWYGKKLHQ